MRERDRKYLAEVFTFMRSERYLGLQSDREIQHREETCEQVVSGKTDRIFRDTGRDRLNFSIENVIIKHSHSGVSVKERNAIAKSRERVPANL